MAPEELAPTSSQIISFAVPGFLNLLNVLFQLQFLILPQYSFLPYFTFDDKTIRSL